MRRVILGVLMILAAMPVSGMAMNRDEGMNPGDGFFVPDGDPVSGKKAFTRFRCSACHWVQNEMQLDAPVTGKTGPMIGQNQAEYAPGWIMNSIVSPSHTIALDSEGEAEGGALSRMGDFKDSMTVRELLDIVAYIRSLDYMGIRSGESESMTAQGGAL